MRALPAQYTFHSFADIPAAEWLVLVNHPDVRRHMPLADGRWTENQVVDWVKGKDAQWQENGYGPWALRVNGHFAGWGGFQKEGDDADLALVLLPAFWGHGRELLGEFLMRRQGLGIQSATILLPPTRTRLKGLARLGFVEEGDVEYDGHRFLKFRIG